MPLKFLLITMLCLLAVGDYNFVLAESKTIKVGWIGAMSGPLSRYGSYQSAILAQEDINASGGIRGKKLELIFEDGKGEGRAAATAAKKLLAVDQVKYLVGGHCSPESLAIAPIAERTKAIMLAAITSNPKLTTAGDYIFRITAVSTIHADLVAQYAMEKMGLKSFVVVYEETEYAIPPAEHFADLVKTKGGKITDIFSYHPGETDFRTIAARIATKIPDAVYLGVQSPESAVLFLRQLNLLKYPGVVYGNEITGNAATTEPDAKKLFEGLIFAEPEFDLTASPTKEFVEHYNKRFSMQNLPYGIWTAEAYDAVRVLASAIEKCGTDVEEVKQCLYAVNNYPGVSGNITIDHNGDGLRNYQLKIISDGEIRLLE